MAPNATMLTPTSPHFPPALRSGTLLTPCPQLWTLGNLDILTTPLLGFFCATRCPGSVILRTYDLAVALREAGVPVIGGFHTPMEKECLEVLLRGRQAVVICPARTIERLRMPMSWRQPYDKGRLLALSPFGAHQRRPTAELAEDRNRFVATLATSILVAYAGPGSKTAQFCGELIAQHRRAYTLDLPDNAHLMQRGVLGYTLHDLIGLWRLAQGDYSAHAAKDDTLAPRQG
jgi:predicted Rossmann fold nucleotide-binding protein DprA/Smf involved in DNA uptake